MRFHIIIKLNRRHSDFKFHFLTYCKWFCSHINQTVTAELEIPSTNHVWSTYSKMSRELQLLGTTLQSRSMMAQNTEAKSQKYLLYDVRATFCVQLQSKINCSSDIVTLYYISAAWQQKEPNENSPFLWNGNLNVLCS